MKLTDEYMLHEEECETVLYPDESLDCDCAYGIIRDQRKTIEARDDHIKSLEESLKKTTSSYLLVCGILKSLNDQDTLTERQRGIIAPFLLLEEGENHDKSDGKK